MKLVAGLFLSLYVGLHWHVKRSVDNHDHVGQNNRHDHKHWGEG